MFSAIARLLFGREEERTENEDKEALPGGDEVDEGWLLLNNKGKWVGIYIALLSKSVASHSHTAGGVNHAKQQPTHQEQLGLGILLRDTLTHYS